MTTAHYTHDLGSPPRPRRGPGLVAAEVLKLAKRRSLAVTTFALTVLPMLVGFTVTTILHRVDPAEHESAGGIENFNGAFGVFAVLVGVAAVLVGATVGSADHSAGVFRELVMTGRSRWHLFLARIPGGLSFLLAAVLAGFSVAAVAAIGLAGSAESPDARLLASSGAWVALAATASFAVSLGVSATVGFRAALGLLLAWQLVVSPLLLSIAALGAVREALLPAALQNLAPTSVSPGAAVVMPAGQAAIVIALWVVAPLVLGAWRTASRDA